MSPHPSVLPIRPSLGLLSDRARQLRKAHAAGDPDAIRRFRAHHPANKPVDAAEARTAGISLRDAQLVIARELGFENWTELKRHVEHRQDASTSTEMPDVPTRITQTVPFFAVSSMQSSLAHYVDGLGFEVKNRWEPDGELRWCWLEHGSTALMMQQHHTQGRNARAFEGQRGEGAAFAYTASEDVSGLLQDGDTWPFNGLTQIVDDDGYTLLAPKDTLQRDAPTGMTLAGVVPVLSVSNLPRSLECYSDGLGFEQVDSLEQNGRMQACRLRRDEVSLVLHQEDSAPERRGQGIGIFHLCESALDLYRELTAREIRTSEPYVGNRMWVVEMRDPDGYRLSFESPTDAPEESTLTEMEAAESKR